MVRVAHISKSYRSGRGRVNAITDISFAIPEGNFAAIVGKSGSGKSTLLYCIGGLEAPDRGEIFCLNQPIHQLNSRQISRFQRSSMGFVFQRGNLLSYLSVEENIGVPLTLNGISGNARARKISQLLEAVDLKSAAKALPSELSGGETQRVSLARAVAHGPKLLLADEPTASLDTTTGHRIVKLMTQLSRDIGCTIVMATHDEEIIKAADLVIGLKDGRITGDVK